MLPAAIVTIFDAKFATVYQPDVSNQLGSLSYGYDPNGCAAGAMQTNLSWEQVFSAGYFQGRNGVEISTLDDVLTRPCAAGATRLYVGATQPYDTALQLELPQIGIFDGFLRTIMVPVTGTGVDPTYGPYITIGAPLPVTGNPTQLPAYGSGAGIFRRRWAGRIGRRTRYHTGQTKKASIALVGISSRLKECVLSGFAANHLDAGAAVYAAINNNASRFSDLNIAAMTQATVGTFYSGTNTNAFVSDVITQIIAAIPNDVWIMRLGADRVPRMLKVYTSATNTYTYSVSLSNHATRFVPMDVQSDDEDTSRMANAILVQGDTSGTSGGTQVQAAAGDAISIGTYGQIDAPITTVTGAKDQATAAAIAAGLLNQTAYPQASTSFKVYVRNDNYAALAAAASPIGLSNGDVCSGFEAITLAGFDETNAVRNAAIDSGIVFGTGRDALWQAEPGNVGISVVPNKFGQDENQWVMTAANGGYANGPRIPVSPGQEWIAGGWMDTTGTTFDCQATWYVFAANGTLLASVQAPANKTAALYKTVPFIIPPGVYMIFLEPSLHLNHPGDTGTIAFFKPQLNIGNTLLPYVSNRAAPNIYGLPSSVTCTMDAAGDRVQAVTFQPVEPDINASILERANAVANAILANTQARIGFDRFVVSPEAADYAYSTAALTVAMPAFRAIFTKGSPVVVVNAINLTLQPSCTTFVWVNPDGTFIQHQNDPSTVPGSILVAYFTTSAMGVVGDFRRASFGVLLAGVGNTDPAGLPAPILAATGNSVTTGPSVNGIAADIDTVLHLTNVPSDGSVTEIEYYYRVTASGSNPANAWIPVGGDNVSATPSFSFGAMLNGATYDLACAYANPYGYGPLTVIASAFVARAIIIPVAYLKAGAVFAPTFAATPAVTVANTPSANGITASVNVTATANNQPVDGSFSRVNFWTRQSTQNNDTQPNANVPGNAACNWSPAGVGLPAVGLGTSPPPASGAYAVMLSEIVGGQNVDIGMTYEDAQGRESDIGTIVENFAATTVIITPGQTSFQQVLNGGFFGLQTDPTGNLVMVGNREIFPSQLPLSIATNPNPPGGILVFSMKFQLTNVTTHPALVIFSDAAPNATDFQNGYMAQWSGNSLQIWRKLNSNYTNMGNASAAATYAWLSVPAAPYQDTSWHELKLVSHFYRGQGPLPAQAAVTGVQLDLYLDGQWYGNVVDFGQGQAIVGFQGSGAMSGNGNTGAAYLTQGICGPANRDAAYPTYIDPTDFQIQTSSGTFAENNSAAVLAAIKSNSSLASGADSPLVDQTATRNTITTGGKNHLFNPTGARGTQGWTLEVYGGSTPSFTTDNYQGGRFALGSSTAGSTLYCGFAQAVNGLFSGYTVTLSGRIECEGTAGVNNWALIDLYDSTETQQIGQSQLVYAPTGATLVKCTGVVPSNGIVHVRCRIFNGSSQAAVTGYFYELQLEYGPTATSYSDDFSAGLVTQTHDTIGTLVGIGGSRIFIGSTVATNATGYQTLGSVSFTAPSYGTWTVSLSWSVSNAANAGVGPPSYPQLYYSISGAFTLTSGAVYTFLNAANGTAQIIGTVPANGSMTVVLQGFTGGNSPPSSIGVGSYTLIATRMS